MATEKDSEVKPPAFGSQSLSLPQELRYGFFNWHPTKLQTINNIKVAVFFLSMANCIQNATNGLLGVSITTLEKRFNFSSLMSSAIASAYEFGQVPTVLFILAYGHKLHRPIFIGIGMICVSIGCFLFFLPQFLMPLYAPSFMDYETHTEKVDLCVTSKYEKDFEPCQSDEHRLAHYLIFFVLGRFLIGVGATPLLTTGITYINDCSTKEDFALYSGIYNAMSIVGPGIGVLSSSFLLNVYVDFYRIDVDSLGFNDDDPRWIGNWWLPYIVLFLISLIIAVPILGYPNDLHGARNIRVDKEKEDTVTVTDFSKMNLLTRIMKLFKNKPFMLSCLFSICEMFIIIGFNAFGPKLFENFLIIPAHVAGITFGLVLLPAGMIGTILGGLLIQKFKMTCKTIIKVQTGITFVTFFLLFSILSSCEPVPFAGSNVPVNIVNYKSSLYDNCNRACMCERTEYQPICTVGGVQYFSACHAGCKDNVYSEEKKIHELFNCSCLSLGDVPGPQAYAESCETQSCKKAIIFLFCFSTAVCLMFICFTMNISIMLRVVRTSQATTAISFQVLITKLLGTIPAPLVFGASIDLACSIWEENSCDINESKCVIFDKDNLTMNILLICLAPKLLACLTMVSLNVFYKPSKKRQIIAVSPIIHSPGETVEPV